MTSVSLESKEARPPMTFAKEKVVATKTGTRASKSKKTGVKQPKSGTKKAKQRKRTTQQKPPASKSRKAGKAQALVPESLMLRALAQLPKTERGTKLRAFWRDVRERGTPLVESTSDDERTSLVTFLWRGADDTKNVVIVGGVVPSWAYTKETAEQQLMTKLPGTNIWYKSYRVRSDARVAYLLSPNDPLVNDETSATWQPDPLNSNRDEYERDPENPESVHVTSVVSVLSLPDAPPRRWTQERADVARGTVQLNRIRSTILQDERRLWVYTPPGYQAGANRYPLLLFFDGWEYTRWIPTPTILDNLVAEARVPPVVAAFVDTVPPHRYQLACYPAFGDFLTKELMPWLHTHFHVSTDPHRTLIGGASLGGLGAAYYAFEYPESFGKVLSQSGSFWWSPPQIWPLQSTTAVDEEPEWLARRIANSSAKRLDFYLEIGLLESVGSPSMLTVNCHLRDVLQAKGYAVHYSEFNGRHDFGNWRETLADGLIVLLGR